MGSRIREDAILKSESGIRVWIQLRVQVGDGRTRNFRCINFSINEKKVSYCKSVLIAKNSWRIFIYFLIMFSTFGSGSELELSVYVHIIWWKFGYCCSDVFILQDSCIFKKGYLIYYCRILIRNPAFGSCHYTGLISERTVLHWKKKRTTFFALLVSLSCTGWTGGQRLDHLPSCGDGAEQDLAGETGWVLILPTVWPPFPLPISFSFKRLRRFT